MTPAKVLFRKALIISLAVLIMFRPFFGCELGSFIRIILHCQLLFLRPASIKSPAPARKNRQSKPIDRTKKTAPDRFGRGTLTATSILFEVVSAFGTVGFSEGITPYLSDTSKVILSIIMLLGRIGPIAAISIFTEKLSWNKESTFQYVEVNIPIG